MRYASLGLSFVVTTLFWRTVLVQKNDLDIFWERVMGVGLRTSREDLKELAKWGMRIGALEEVNVQAVFSAQPVGSVNNSIVA